MTQGNGTSRTRLWVGLGALGLGLLAVLLAVYLLGPEKEAGIWRAPVHPLVYVQVEKALRDPFLDAEQAAGLPAEKIFKPLPPEVVRLLGDSAVDYDGFTGAYLDEGAAKGLIAAAARAGLVATLSAERRVELPWHGFSARDKAGRSAPGFREKGEPVPGLFLVQLAYPLREEWTAALSACGIRQLAYFHERTLLVKAESDEKLRACAAIAPYIAWIDHFLTTDRYAPETFAQGSAEGWDLHYAPGANVRGKEAALAAGIEAEAVPETAAAELPAQPTLHVRGPAASLRAIADADADLLSVTRRSTIELSDERQGQIVAGNHDGARVNLTPRYRAWLQERCLIPGSAAVSCPKAAANQQTVCMVDGGYDTGFQANGQPPSGKSRHPDLAGPERVLRLQNFPNPILQTSWDRGGHGTMVAGIIAGAGGTPPSPPLPLPYTYPLADAEGYLYGSGVSPLTRIVFARMEPISLDPSVQANAYRYCRNDPATQAEAATIASNSWNEKIMPTPGFPYVLPQNEYTQLAQLFDSLVLDANSGLAGQQPMTIVFSAGNHAYHPPDQTSRPDSVASPALAKNVIAVGATASYRPAGGPTGEPIDCVPTPNGDRPPNHDATHIARVANFSGRGRPFAGSGAAGKLHTVRVKPDLVAPGVRVFSPVPFNTVTYGQSGVNGCVRSWPPPPPSYTPYTYGTGTSFAAPVVTGVATFARKWFLDRNVTSVSPSLIKAALIATAEDLGGLEGNDRRPSPIHGWGRVSLGRLTDSAARFFVTDNQAIAVATGQQRSWTRTVDAPGRETLIVLAWSDPPADVPGNSQAALKNNLGLAVEEVGRPRFWRGNNFQENVTGNDTGYSHRFRNGGTPFIDAINNVEAVFIPANTFPAGQRLTIKVTGENVTAGKQRFAVYAYNVRRSS